MDKLKVLYVTSEINPFLNETLLSGVVRKVTQDMFEHRGMDLRIMVPKFGLINDRMNGLHEVIRLSGANISMWDEDKLLIIKVASIPNTRLQVYFLDNEEYFQRKSGLYDEDKKFHGDNDDRAIFFCKGVIETVKRLRWSPDIVHCYGWFSSLVPLYMNTTYKNDPNLRNAKIVFTPGERHENHKFDDNLCEKVRMFDIRDYHLNELRGAEYEGFLRVGIQNSDAVVYSDEINRSVLSYLRSLSGNGRLNKPAHISNAEGDMLEKFHYDLYSELVETSVADPAGVE